MEEIMNFVSKFNIRSMIISLVLIVVSILIIANPETVLPVIIILLGIGIMIDGIWHAVQFARTPDNMKTYSFDLVQGLAELIFGIIFVSNQAFIISIIYLIIGIWIVFESAMKIQIVLTQKDLIPNWFPVVVLSGITIVAGLIIIAHPLIASTTVTLLIGIALLISEVLNLADSIYLSIKLKDLNNGIETIKAKSKVEKTKKSRKNKKQDDDEDDEENEENDD